MAPAPEARSHPLVAARIAPLYSSHVFLKGWRTLPAPGERSRSESDSPADAELRLEASPYRSLQHLVHRDAGFLGTVRRLEVA